MTHPPVTLPRAGGSAWRRRWAGNAGTDAASGDRGSVLIEVLIGFSLFAVVILATGTGTMFATAATSIAQQRSTAANLIASDIASIESLPFNDVAAGLNPSAETLTNDTNIQQSGSTYTLTLTGATLATSNTQNPESPLVPHVTTTTIGIPYTVKTYPLAGSSGTVTVVVVVTWKSALGGTAQVVGETKVAAP